MQPSILLSRLAVSALLVSSLACEQQLDDGASDVELQVSALCSTTKLTPVAAVSSAAPKQAASKAIDNNTGTRWESAFSDPQWLYVDLGAVKKVTQIKIDWQRSAAKDYRIDVSNDAINWSAPVVTRTGNPAVDHRIDDLTGLTINARYVRVYGTARTTVYGYSIWELSLYGETCTTGAGGAGGTGAAGTGSAGTGSAGTTGSGGCASNNLTTSTTLVATATSGTASRAFDNNVGTRWESAFSDPQSITIDLGALKKINRVRIDWETAAAKDYRIQVSTDGASFATTIVTKTGLPATMHRIDDWTGFSVNARYVRMSGTARATAYGYSIWEMDVYGDANPSCGGGSTGGAGTGAAGTGAAGTGAAGAPATCGNAVFTLAGAVASSATQPASRAIDGNVGTRWESAFSDPQWIYFDLGSRKALRQLRIDWETASASTYSIDVSDDAATWSPILTRSGLGSVQHRIDDTFGIFGAGRYVRVFGTQRSTGFGYSIWELRASGDASPGCGNHLTAGWDHGNVASTFSPTAGFTFDAANKNAIKFDYTGRTFTTTGFPQLIEFTQTVTIPRAGNQWRLTLDVTGMNDQTGRPPQFFATLDGNSAAAFLPQEVSVATSGGRIISVGSLTTGRKLIVDFGLSLATNASVEVVLTNVPTFDGSGVGLQRFTVSDVTLERLDLN